MGIGWSIHKNDGWQGQLERVRRWHGRLIHSAAIRSVDLEDFALRASHHCLLPQLGRMGRRSQDKESQMRCMVCGAQMRSIITDLPFKLSEQRIVILKQLPVLQC